MTPRVRKRRSMMLWAYLTFHARNVPEFQREAQCWLYLLEWASLGGTADEGMGC